jgi:anti-sigma B factor antagonist
MEVRVTENGSVKIVEVEGEVDLYSSPQLRKILLDLTKDEPNAILVDLGLVKYMDSSGIATMVEALQQTRKNSGKLKLANLRDAVRDVFELSRLDKVFDIYPTINDAMSAF